MPKSSADDDAARTGDATSLLFVGDVIGAAGVEACRRLLPELCRQYAPSFVVVNGENSAGGLGITPELADELLELGADAITLGNHALDRDEIFPYLEARREIVRPANFPASDPGRGVTVVERGGTRLAVVNLSGNTFMSWHEPSTPLLRQADLALAEIGDDVDHILVDVHAEMCFEKIALGWYFDGRVTAIVGTHTHVPTADARVLPGGTAYITDVGMTGGRRGVVGVNVDLAVESLLSGTDLPFFTERYATSDEDPWLMGVLVRCDERRGAREIEQLLVNAEAGVMLPAAAASA